jgi:hypothetical protein
MAPTSFANLLTRLICLGCCWLGMARLVQGAPENYFPEKPPGMVIDKAGVMLPEKAAALNDALLAEAQRSNIWVYVLTLPSVDVRPAIKHERLSNIAHYYVDLWARDRPAFILLFDDESRDAVLAASKEMDRQFPPWTRNLRLTQPLSAIVGGDEFTREKVDKAARLTVTTLVEMQRETQRKARQEKIVKIGMLVFFAAAGGIILYSSLRKRRGDGTKETESEKQLPE